MNVNLKNNKQDKTLIKYQLAIDIIKRISDRYKISDNEEIKLLNSHDCLLSKDYYSPINVPTFNNSAMDGFALQSHVVNKLIDNMGYAKLQVTGSIQAGDKEEINANEANSAWEIMTGAPVPDLFDAVIQLENVQFETEDNGQTKYITIKEKVFFGRNIRKLGTDYKKNQLVVDRHTQIQAQHIMALATVGIENIHVVPKIKVAILSTGNELAKTASHSLNSGKIFNSNQPYLKKYCQSINCDPIFVERCKDKLEDFNQLIDSALEKNVKIIFSTGAVSMGKYDFIPKALKQRGAKIHFHKARIKPGKPILFAELPENVIYFGLPGNPIAAASGMRFFVIPFIRNMLNLAPEKPLKAKLLNNLTSKIGFRTFAKAFANIDDYGQLCVNMLLDQGSYQARSFAQSNCWLIIPEQCEEIKAGELVEIAPMIPNKMNF